MANNRTNLIDAIAELKKLDSFGRTWQESAVLKALEAIQGELEEIKKVMQKTNNKGD